MTWAARAGLIKDNPAALVSLLRESARTLFPQMKIRRLFRAADQHESFYTGQYVKMLLPHWLCAGPSWQGQMAALQQGGKTYTSPHQERP